MQRRAYQRGRLMIWPALAAELAGLVSATSVTPRVSEHSAHAGIGGLLRICDDTGILQPSVHDIPDRAHGYCVSDNARALMLTNRPIGSASCRETVVAYVLISTDAVSLQKTT